MPAVIANITNPSYISETSVDNRSIINVINILIILFFTWICLSEIPLSFLFFQNCSLKEHGIYPFSVQKDTDFFQNLGSDIHLLG